jgi:hypothetical protein
MPYPAVQSIAEHFNPHGCLVPRSAERRGTGSTSKMGAAPESLSAKTILGEMFDALRNDSRTARL